MLLRIQHFLNNEMEISNQGSRIHLLFGKENLRQLLYNKKKNTKSDGENLTERLAKFKTKILQIMDQHGKVQNMNYKN